MRYRSTLRETNPGYTAADFDVRSGWVLLIRLNAKVNSQASLAPLSRSPRSHTGRRPVRQPSLLRHHGMMPEADKARGPRAQFGCALTSATRCPRVREPCCETVTALHPPSPRAAAIVRSTCATRRSAARPRSRQLGLDGGSASPRGPGARVPRRARARAHPRTAPIARTRQFGPALLCPRRGPCRRLPTGALRRRHPM